ncbi:hypothetical protein [Absidia glauca]|uniref:mRNA guanylyltransferase n=1 Tax=Absidia glauca TaxID=4829 RepID=A0A168Q1G7_ABSGL|nr:hypothetical protein [Absidia glauca]
MPSLQSSPPASSLVDNDTIQQSSDLHHLLDSFGERVDQGYSHTLLTRVKALLQLTDNNNSGFPGTQPVSFEMKHFALLEREDYFVCEKSNGIRCLLFFVHSPKGPASFMLDRKQRWYFIPELLFPVRGRDGEYLKDTLMDGELVVDNDPNSNTKKSLRFLIFDLMVMNGMSLTHRSFSTRLGVLQQDVIQPLKLHLRSPSEATKARPPFTLELKKMERSYGLHLVFEQIAKLRHDSDGIIWTPVNCPYVPGVCDRLLEWKPPENISLNFKINAKWNNDHKPIYSLNVLSHLTYKFFDHFQPDSDWTMQWKDLPPEGRIAEFRYDSLRQVTIVEQGYAPTTKTGGWRFIRFCDDKDAANQEVDAKKTINSIQYGVSKEQLLAHLEHIRDAWKIREQGLPPPTRSMVVSTSVSSAATNQQLLPTPSPKSPAPPSSAISSNSSNQQEHLHLDHHFVKSRQNSMDCGLGAMYNSRTDTLHSNGNTNSTETADGSFESHSQHHYQTSKIGMNGRHNETKSLPGSRRQSLEGLPKRNSCMKKEDDTERKRHKSLTALDKSHLQHMDDRQYMQQHKKSATIDRGKMIKESLVDPHIDPPPINNITSTDLSNHGVGPIHNILKTGSPTIEYAKTPPPSHSLATVLEDGHTTATVTRCDNQYDLEIPPTNSEFGPQHSNGGRTVSLSSDQQPHRNKTISSPSPLLYSNTLQNGIRPLEAVTDLGKSFDSSESSTPRTSCAPLSSSPSLPSPSIPRLQTMASTDNRIKVSSPAPSPSPSSSPSPSRRIALQGKRPSSHSIHKLLTASTEPIAPPPMSSAVSNQMRPTVPSNRQSHNISPLMQDPIRQQQQQNVKPVTKQPHQSIGTTPRSSSSTTHAFPIQFINFHADRSGTQTGSPSAQKTIFIQGEYHSDGTNNSPTDRRSAIASNLQQQQSQFRSRQRIPKSEPAEQRLLSHKLRKPQTHLQGSSAPSSAASSPRHSTSGKQLDTWRVTKAPIPQRQQIQPALQKHIYEKRHPLTARVHPQYTYPPPQQNQQPYPYSSFYTPLQDDYNHPNYHYYHHHPVYQQPSQSSHQHHISVIPQHQLANPNPSYLNDSNHPTHHPSHQHALLSTAALSPPDKAFDRKSSKAKLDFILN